MPRKQRTSKQAKEHSEDSGIVERMPPRLAGPLCELLVIGLGNATHPGTRHSVGHMMIDSLAARFGVRLQQDRTFLAGQMTLNSTTRITFAKTKPLMNISGKSVVLAMKTRLETPNASAMVVLHDSLDHKSKVVSAKFGGSASGHNGVRDIISSLGGNKDFHRIRLGIGRSEGGDVAEYVLGRLSQEEKSWWSETGSGTELVLREIEKIIGDG